MVDRGEVERALGSARSKPERIEALGALLAQETGDEVVIVGGSAIEVYTSGRTSSRDIDLVTPRRAAIRAIESWGFVPSGRVWRRQDWDLDIDLLGADLKGSRENLRKMVTPYGPVSLLGVEDLLIKRLVELKHWPTSPDWDRDLRKQVRLLLAQYGTRLNEEYLDFIAQRDDVVDILADFRHPPRAGSLSPPRG